MSKNKSATAIALFLMATIAFTLVALPVVTAHTPPWTKVTWAYIAVSPNPIGVNQEALIVFWLDVLPQTASGAYGDRYHWYVDVTKPNGDTETLGGSQGIESDPVGGGYTTYTPDQVGTYTFVARFPGITYAGANPPPGGFNPSYGSYINDTLQPSQSDPVKVIVQEEPIPAFQPPPLPTDYWTRPIYATNREWAQIAGNWLGGGSPSGNFNPYAEAPSTAHIVWTKPTEFGGIVGEPYDDLSYHTGSAYETMWTAGIIIQGRLYYNEPKAPRYGWYCVDLRTGEEIFYNNGTGPIQIGSQTSAHIGGTEIPYTYPVLAWGQIYDYETPNQHGCTAYLWSTYTDTTGSNYTYKRTNGSTYSFSSGRGSLVWQLYDAFNGKWICNIANVPSSGAMFAPVTRTVGSDGSELIYIYNSAAGWLALWNSSVALGFPNNNLEVPYSAYASAEAYYWMWREPIGRTVDGNNGFSWNITVPKNLGGINTILSDKIIGTSGLASFQYGVGPYSVWAMSLEPGSMGTILWEHDFAGAPTPNATVIMGPVSEEDGVFMMRVKETRQWYGYDLNSGKQIWGPTDSQEQYNMYGMGGNIAYGKLYSTGYAGILYCYNATTGSLLWNSSLNTGGLEGPYPNWPAASTYIADHKVYITTGEHSHTQPLLRGWTIYCFDAETGKGLWNITNLASALSIADGYLVDFDYMDNSIYCFGKGQTATTVMASPDVSTHGDSVLIKGTVTDQSPGAAGTPAIADQYMTEWMEYLYHQRQMPKAAGVEVVLETLDPNGNFYEIGRTTSDASGMYSYPFTPEVPGLYTLIATFEGSGSYFSSVAEIAINVLEAPQATPTPTLPPSNTNTYVIGFGSAALIAIIVVGVILILLRKR